MFRRAKPAVFVIASTLSFTLIFGCAQAPAPGPELTPVEVATPTIIATVVATTMQLPVPTKTPAWPPKLTATPTPTAKPTATPTPKPTATPTPFLPTATPMPRTQTPAPPKPTPVPPTPAPTPLLPTLTPTMVPTTPDVGLDAETALAILPSAGELGVDRLEFDESIIRDVGNGLGDVPAFRVHIPYQSRFTELVVFADADDADRFVDQEFSIHKSQGYPPIWQDMGDESFTVRYEVVVRVGRYVLIAMPIFNLDQLRPSVQRLQAFVSPRTPAKSIVFVDWEMGNLEIFVENADGSVINLTNHPSADAYPSLSPDGTRIVFASNRDGPAHVFVMNVDGSGLARLTNSASGDTMPGWSPDGTRIVYQTLLPNHNWEIYVMNADGSGQTNLTNNPAIDTSPAWSPDGTRIVFETNHDGDFEIYVMDADGSGQTNLTNNPAAYDIAPAWSPDGRQIIFRSDRDGDRFEYKPYVMNADGSQVTPLE